MNSIKSRTVTIVTVLVIVNSYSYTFDLAQAGKAVECENSKIEVWVPSSILGRYFILEKEYIFWPSRPTL